MILRIRTDGTHEYEGTVDEIAEVVKAQPAPSIPLAWWAWVPPVNPTALACACGPTGMWCPLHGSGVHRIIPNGIQFQGHSGHQQ